MKIGLVAPFFPPEIGGANIYCFELAKSLAAKGNEVHVFTKANGATDPAYLLHPILTLDLAWDLQLLRAYEMDVWHSLFFFYAPLAFYKPNVFITGHGDDIYSFRICYKLPGRRWLAKHVLWRQNETTRATLEHLLRKAEIVLNRRIYNLAVRRALGVIAVSSFSRSRLCSYFPAATGRTTVVPPGVGSRFFDKGPDRKGQNFLLTVSRLDEADRIKNVHGVINALGDLKDDYEFRYVIVAGAVAGGYRKELEQLIVTKGLEEKVSIEGRKTDEELAAYYASADLFILVSYADPDNFEGFGIVFLEANASGTPVLTSREGGMVDYVRDGVNGFYVEETSAAGIRAALEKYLKGQIKFDPAKVRLAPEPYKWTHIADRVLELYATRSG